MVHIKGLMYCVVMMSLLPIQSVLANEEALTAKVEQCSKITKDQDRLHCFDQLVTKKSNVSTVVPTTVLTAQQLDTFAKEHVQETAAEKAQEITSISLTISKLKKSPRGEWNISFSNGQKWKQKDGSRMKLKVGEEVSLNKGALGVVYLENENTNKRMKVKRIK
jgi:hypothetical protein